MSKNKPSEDQKEVIRIRGESLHRYKKDLYIDVEPEYKVEIQATWTPPKTEGWIIDRYEKNQRVDTEKLAWDFNSEIDSINRTLEKQDLNDWFVEYLKEELKKYKGWKQWLDF